MTAAETLQKRAARLTTRQTHRFVREDGGIERVTLPPLLELLATRLASSQTLTAGGASGPKSKPPIAVDAFDLLREIDETVAEACLEYGLTLRFHRPTVRDAIARATAGDYRVADRVVSALITAGYRIDYNTSTGAPRDVIGNLHQLVPALIAAAGGDPDAELLTRSADQLAAWASRIEAVIGDREEGTAVVPLPIECPDCATDYVTRLDQGETYRERAVIAQVFRHEVQSITCRACEGMWSRGEALDGMILESVGHLLGSLPRTDALGYDLALGYAPPMFTAAEPAPRADLEAEADSQDFFFKPGDRVEVHEVPGGYVVLPAGTTA